MNQTLVLLSGSVAAGKTAVATSLMQDHGYARLSSGGYLRDYAVSRGLDIDRLSLQRLGDTLDAETDFEWVVSAVAVPALSAHSENDRWLFDAVRKKRQVEHFRSSLPCVLHVHLTAPESVLAERYIGRLAGSGVGRRAAAFEYSQAIAHPNEVESRSLSLVADRLLDTSTASAREIALRIVMGG